MSNLNGYNDFSYFSEGGGSGSSSDSPSSGKGKMFLYIFFALLIIGGLIGLGFALADDDDEPTETVPASSSNNSTSSTPSASSSADITSIDNQANIAKGNDDYYLSTAILGTSIGLRAGLDNPNNQDLFDRSEF